jgi:hypothetical protein
MCPSLINITNTIKEVSSRVILGSISTAYQPAS